MPRKGIKVVKSSSYRYWSALPFGLKTQYYIGKWTVRTKKHGPFAVFKNIKHARKFIRQTLFYPVKIFECEYTKSLRKKLFHIHVIDDVPYIRSLHYLRLPKGTVCANKVRLIKEIID